MGNRTDYGALKHGFGLARGLADEFLQVCDSKNVPIEAIHRLVTPRGRATLEALAERIRTDWAAESPKAERNGPFVARVVYEQPEFDELKCRFPGYVNDDFRTCSFSPIPSSVILNFRIIDSVFEYVRIRSNGTTEEVLSEIAKRGLRPAQYVELLGFAEKYPDEQRKFSIVALGSTSYTRGAVRVPYLRYGNGFGLGMRLLSSHWRDADRFLAVRE
jgi:hypothetical protein